MLLKRYLKRYNHWLKIDLKTVYYFTYTSRTIWWYYRLTLLQVFVFAIVTLIYLSSFISQLPYLDIWKFKDYTSNSQSTHYVKKKQTIKREILYIVHAMKSCLSHSINNCRWRQVLINFVIRLKYLVFIICVGRFVTLSAFICVCFTLPFIVVQLLF